MVAVDLDESGLSWADENERVAIVAGDVRSEEVNALVPFVPRQASETFRVFDPKVRGVTSSARNMTNYSKAWIAK